MTTPSLPPAFMALHSHRPEALRDLVLGWMARHPLAPLEDEWVLVQSNGVAQWLKMALAAPVGQGGSGIAAALRTELPARFIWQAYRAVLGAGWQLRVADTAPGYSESALSCGAGFGVVEGVQHAVHIMSRQGALQDMAEADGEPSGREGAGA